MARVKYHTYGRNGVKVSTQWLTALRAADRAKVRFTVTSGHRTLPEQWRLYRLWKAGKGNLAAFPSPTAPHIRVGNPAHALDVNSRDGGEQRLQNWLNSHAGINARNTVQGEAWHLELTAAELRKLYDRYKRQTPRKARWNPRELDLSARGLTLIKRFEGLRLEAYKAHSSEKYWTIGYGDYGPHVRPGQVITKAEAERRLRKRLVDFEQAVRRVGVPMTQSEYDATVSFVYNLGPGVLDKDRTFGRLLRARKYGRAGASMQLYVNAGGVKLLGLVRRRRAERRLFNR